MNSVFFVETKEEVKDQIRQAIKKDIDFQPIIQTLQGLPVEKTVPSSLLKHYTTSKDDMLMYDQRRLCIPKGPLRAQILHDHHDAPIAGHQGIEQTYAAMHERFYWPWMNN